MLPGSPLVRVTELLGDDVARGTGFLGDGGVASPEAVGAYQGQPQRLAEPLGVVVHPGTVVEALLALCGEQRLPRRLSTDALLEMGPQDVGNLDLALAGFGFQVLV